MERPRCLGRCPSRLDQHCTGVRSASLADPSILNRPEAGLPHPRIEPDVTHELLRAGESLHVTDRGNEAGRDRQIDAGDGQQPLYS